WNQADNRFEDEGDGNTRWVMETEFKCKGVMWLMTKLMPGMFKGQTQKTMEAFRVFMEQRPTGE
ncbi:MAG: SRPBCC family protein, partial [Nannocystaceae bacterium]